MTSVHEIYPIPTFFSKIIKVRQPPPPPTKKRRRTTITPENAGLRAHLQPNGVSLNGISSSSKKLPSDSSTPLPRADDLPLMSFVDMIFGGQLTSILVCQKCKNVSQTYEDFNDISLSLKPEDYANRKRDRFRKIVGRLTNFPASTFNNLQAKEKQTQPSSTTIPPIANIVEAQRSSSVPPTPSEEKRGSFSGGGLEGPPRGASRRRSLDLESLLQDGAVEVGNGSQRLGVGHSQDSSGTSEVKAKDTDEDCGMISDGSHIIVNVNGPEERHVEFVESRQRKEVIQGDQDAMDVKEKKQSEEAAWSRFGRRISLNLGLGRQKDKKERERKVRSVDRPLLNTGGIKEDEVEGIDTVVRSVTAAGAAPKSRGSPTETPNDAEPPQHLSQQPIPSGLPSSKQDLLPNPDLAKEHASNAASKFPTIQRSRSPKPPKPSPAETEYLRKILADVSFPSNSPFALLRPPLLHDPTPGPSGEKEKVGGPAWLGLGARTFSGIEECLRMFTAVEVLDGENMVGCRRCWKIQNGIFHSKKDESDEEEGEEGVESPMSVPGMPNDTANMEPPSLVVQPTLIIPSPACPSSPIHLQASQSTPTVSYYPHRESHSTPSLPTSISDANLNLMKDNSAEDSVSSLSLSIVSERSEYTKESDGPAGHNQGPGGLPIPIISTTAPMDASSTSTSMPSDSGSESNYSSASEGNSPLSRSIEELNRRAAYARLTRGLSNNIGRSFQKIPLSTDSLVIPPRTHGNRQKLSLETTTDEESSEDESDAAESISAESRPDVNPIGTSGTILVPSGAEKTSSQQSHGQVSEKPQKKVSKPKPVIMRPAYKRYLIAMPPPVLVIHLKRFQQTLKAPLMLSFSNGFKKLDDYVSFPEYLDLSPFLAPRKEDYGLGKKRKEKEFKKRSNFREERCMYRLYGVVVHIGNMVLLLFVRFSAKTDKSFLAWWALHCVYCSTE